VKPVWAKLAASWPVARYFTPRVYPHAGALAAALVLGAVVALAELARPWPVQLIFDQVLVPRAHAPHPLGIDLTGMPLPAAVGAAAFGVLLVSALGGLAAYAQTIVLAEVGQRVVARIRRDLFRHLLRLPVTFHSGRRSGDLLMRLTGDIVLLRELVVSALLDGAGSLLLLAGTLALMAWLDPILTLLSLAVTPLVAFAGAALGARIRRAVRRARTREGALSGSAGEALGAIAVVQAFGADRAEDDRFSRENRSGLRSGLKAARAEALLARTLDLLTAAGAGVTLAAGTWSVTRGDLTPGGLLVFLAYQRSLYKPIRRLARMTARTARAAACGERVIEILETPVPIADAKDARPCPALRGHVRFEHVTVRYPRGDVALAGLNAEIPAGAMVLVRGHSGAGKSTLGALLPRLIDPTRGAVRFDGVDIRSYTLESVRRRVAVVFQDSVLMGFSLRDNIRMGRPEASDAEVEAAAARAGVSEFAARLPDGLDTRVGERGAELSGGQRQRVAIARAALRDAAILVLDEPFAHLDAANRRHVSESLRALCAGRTTFMIAHDEARDWPADLELHLAEGRLIERRAAMSPARVAS